MNVRIIKSVDTVRVKDDNIGIERIARLEQRYKSAAGQQQGVISEVFALLHQQNEMFGALIRRIEALENR